MERVVEHLDGAARGVEAARRRCPPTRQRSSGSCSPRRQVDARELEQRDRRSLPGIDVLARRPRPARRASVVRRIACVAAHRVGQADRVRVGIGGDEAPGVRLAEAGADEDVLDDAAAAAAPRSDGPATARRSGIVVRHPVEHDARDLLDEVDLARDVARAPRRDGHVPVVGDLEAEPLEDLRAARRGATSSPTTRSVRSGRRLTTGRAGRPRWTSALPAARRRRGRRGAGSRAPRRARRDDGSTPFSQRFEPSVRRPSRSEVCRTPIGSKFAASSSTSVVVARRPRCRRRP